jgi:acetylornithine/N-succinyldiaminopimelate aminotransferase
MLKYDTIKQLDDDYIYKTYNRMPALFVQGAGSKLWDNRGNEYLDLLAGIGVCQLGHCHPAVVAAITRQAQQLIHVSNILLTAPQAKLAQRLAEISGMERAFFAVCGATANEAAIKVAKKHANNRGLDGDYQIVCLDHAFHGRTLGALSATGKEAYQHPFRPVVPGFVHIEPGNREALRAAVGPRTAAIMLETVMGEGNVLDLSAEYLQEARRLADEFGCLLICDEVQCGMGRTGKWFAYQHAGILPDVVCLAKGLGSGVPIGAILARGEAARTLVPGDHGSTFGGNPLACAAALAVIDTIEHQGLLDHTTKVGNYLKTALATFPGVVKTTGKGLMIGAELDQPIAREIVQKAFHKGLILNATDEYHLRLVPPLVLTEAEAEQALTMLAEVMEASVEVPAFVRATVAPRHGYHDLLKIEDLTLDQMQEVLSLAAYQKQRRKLAPAAITPVENRTVAMVFEKQSLRTRVSFETAIYELGGHAIHLGKGDIAMGSRESLQDVTSNLNGWCSAIVARLYWQDDLEEMARIAEVPVINALTNWEHPCQALADLQTIREEFGADPVKIAYVGDGNNVARSLAKLGLALGYPVTLVGPKNFQLEDMTGLVQTEDLVSGLEGASVVYTDVWVSMGDEREQDQRLKTFRPYQVNEDVMAMADPSAIFLHCLPARRGLEVTDGVIDGAQSRIVAQAENRLHAQKALLAKTLGLG